MSISFISSMNVKLYEEYGKRFLYEFAEHADSSIKLFIIFEGPHPIEAINISENIFIIPFIDTLHQKFLKFFGKLYEAQGLKIKTYEDNGQQKIKLINDYKFNAIRFSFKPFAINYAKDYLPENLEYLIWTDADLRCKKHFKQENIEDFLPNNNQIMSYLGRKNFYSECGFLGFNLKHNHFNSFLDRVIEIYQTGEIFSLEQWHDSWIWDYVRIEFEKKEFEFKNIAGRGYEYEHVFINSGLEEYFDHLKGPLRKKEGKSFDKDYI